MAISTIGQNGLAVPLITSADASISGLTVGKGGGAVASNTAIGAAAISATATGGYNTAVGSNSMSSLTSGQLNTAIGYGSSFSLTTASQTVSVGEGALTRVTTGSDNTGLGFQSLTFVSTGTNNTGVGSQALWSNTTASNNTAVGYQALYSNTTNADSTAIGYGALYYANAIENTAIGKNAGNSTTSGTSNVYVGMQAGNWNVNHTTGSNCVFIGERTSPAVGSDSYEIVIGAGCVGKGGSTGFISPNSGGVYQGNNSTAWQITSDQRLKKNIVDNTTGLSAITAIQVRNFEYRTKDEITELEPQNAIDIKGVQLGAIAQELQAILPDCVKTETTGVMSVDASNLTWYLVNAVKELNAKVTALETQLQGK